MQDVEIVDVATDLPLDAPPEDPAAEAERARRAARRRRLLRRWWPVPVAVALAAVGTQVVVDARADARVTARQEVPGVLGTVDPALPTTRLVQDELTGVVLHGFPVGDLRVGAPSPPRSAGRELVAVDDAGTEVWAVSLEDTGDATPDVGMEYPVCTGQSAPAPAVRCLLLDRAPDAEEATGTWQPGPPTGARLVTVDAATGTVTASREVPALSGWGGSAPPDDDAALQVLASVVDGALRVTAWDVAADPGAPDDPAAAPLWRTEVALGDDLAVDRLYYPPSIWTPEGRVVVQGEMGTWVLDGEDGTLQLTSDQFLSVTRTGYLAVPDAGLRLLDDDGREVLTLPGSTAYLAVDDGSLPGVELVTAYGGDARLAAIEVPSGRELWSSPRVPPPGTTLLLLEGVLYGAGPDAVWALDTGTGRELWRTEASIVTDTGGAMTDGRYLLAPALVSALTEAGVPVAPAAGQDAAGADGGDGVGTGDEHGYALAAFDLATGAPAWATRLPEGVSALWAQDGDLVGWLPDGDVVVLG